MHFKSVLFLFSCTLPLFWKDFCRLTGFKARRVGTNSNILSIPIQLKSLDLAIQLFPKEGILSSNLIQSQNR